jgi:hypothetical protein
MSWETVKSKSGALLASNELRHSPDSVIQSDDDYCAPY